jgi:hypothetical protein
MDIGSAKPADSTYVSNDFLGAGVKGVNETIQII